MYLAVASHPPAVAPERRQFARLELQCRARIRIGARHYAGYLHDISQGGAKLRTISSIRKLGDVLLRLPDLPPLRCQLKWTDCYNAGVGFEVPLTREQLERWIRTRNDRRLLPRLVEAEICCMDRSLAPGDCREHREGAAGR